MRRLLVLYGLLLANLGAMCRGEEAFPKGRDSLKVISFNAQFLPGTAGLLFNLRPDADYRARTLAKRLADGGYDIIGLNEIFDAKATEILTPELKKQLGPQFHAVIPPASERSEFGIGSGLMLVTRLPVVASKTRPFNNTSPLTRSLSADGLARKGILYARLDCSQHQRPAELDVFLTHLESVDAAIREAQIAQLADFVRAQGDARRPTLILGDLNLDGRPSARGAKSPHDRMLETLRRIRPDLQDVWETLRPSELGVTKDEGTRIDYILLAKPTDKGQSFRPTVIRVNPFLDPKVQSLSDHSAVEAEIVP